MAISGLSLSDTPVRQQLLLYALILIGGGYFFYAWYLQPLRETSLRQEQTLETLRAQVQQAKLVQAQLPQFKQEVARQRSRLERFKATLPSEKETPELMKRLQELAETNHLNIKTFTPQQTVRQDFYADWPIQMSLEGNFHNLGEFFERVGRMNRLMNVGDLTIRSLEESEGRERTIAATCTATTFVFLEEEESSS